MAERLDKALETLLHADTADTMDGALGDVLDELMEFERAEWPTALTQIIAAIEDYTDTCLGTAKLDNPFFVCPPPLATLRFLLDEIRMGSYEPRWTIAKLDYYRESLAKCDPILAQQSYEIACVVLSFLEEKYHVFSSALRAHVMSIPFCDIKCVAECTAAENVLEMFLNATEDKNCIISMAIDLAAQAIACDEVPEAGIRLLKQTSVPGIRSMNQDEKYTCYLDAIATGLVYGSPYDKVIAYDSAWAEAWNAYVKNVIQKRSTQ